MNFAHGVIGRDNCQISLLLLIKFEQMSLKFTECYRQNLTTTPDCNEYQIPSPSQAPFSMFSLLFH